MLKRITALLLMLIMMTAAVLPASAVSAPALPRVYRPDMYASVGYYGGEKYIALDIIINEITEPTGLLSIGFNIEFDGDALVPLWQTDRDLNGDGTMAGKYNPPQMITSWPTFNFSFGGQDRIIHAAEGLCKPYSVTGKGVLNVNLVVNIDYVDEGITEDGAMALRLYFTPTAGFREGDSYTFTIDGQYEETVPQKVIVEGTNNNVPRYERVLGYGSSTSVTLTYADCGAFDLSASGVELGIAPDGAKGILWVKEGTTAEELSSAFATAKVISTQGKNLTVSAGNKTLTVAVKGDINTDGTLSTADYILLRSALQGNATLNDLQTKIADTNCNGKLSTADALFFTRLFGKQ